MSDNATCVLLLALLGIIQMQKAQLKAAKALLAERDEIQSEYDELVSYLPKVPTEPYEKRLAQIRAHASAYVQTRSTFLNDIAFLLALVAEYERALTEIFNERKHFGACPGVAKRALAEAERLAGGGD